MYRDQIGTILRRLRADSCDNRCTECWYNCRGEVESLYHPYSLLRSLPTLLVDQGRAKAALPRANGAK